MSFIGEGRKSRLNNLIISLIKRLYYAVQYETVMSCHVSMVSVITVAKNKAGYTATPVACGWAGAVIEVTRSFGQEQ